MSLAFLRVSLLGARLATRWPSLGLVLSLGLSPSPHAVPHLAPKFATRKPLNRRKNFFKETESKLKTLSKSLLTKTIKSKNSSFLAGAHLIHIGHRVKNGQESMLLVEALGLAGRAQVIIGAHGALEAGPNYLSLATVTSHPRVNHGLVMRRWTHRRVSWRTHVVWSWRRGAGEPLVHMWEVTLVLLFF